MADLNDSGLAACGAEDPVVVGKGAGMGCGGPFAGLAPASFQKDNRFFLSDPFGALEKPPAVSDAFHIEHHGLSQLVVFKGLQEVFDSSHRFIP